MLSSKKLSSKINYDALNDLFDKHGSADRAITAVGEKATPRGVSAAGGGGARAVVKAGGFQGRVLEGAAGRLYVMVGVQEPLGGRVFDGYSGGWDRQISIRVPEHAVLQLLPSEVPEPTY